MLRDLNRRSFLLGSAAALAGSAAPFAVRASGAAPVKLTVGRRTIEVQGRAAPAFGITQPDGTSGLTLEHDDRFLVDLVNDAGEDTIIHWHGQLPPFLQDGFPDKDRPLIPQGGRQSYDFAPTPGTHWMHSHQGLQAQRQMNAPLIVRTVEDERADVQEVVLFLDDFSFTPPEEILANLAKSENSMASMLGKPDDTGATDTGMVMPAGDLNDVTFDAFLANDRTLDDPFVASVERNGRVRLRIINGAASTQFWIDFGPLHGTVIAVDGNPTNRVRSKRLPLAIAQRLDVLLDVPDRVAVPVFAQVEGKQRRTGIVLAGPGASISKLPAIANNAVAAVDHSLEGRLSAVTPLDDRPIDNTLNVALTGAMASYTWSLNDEMWPQVTPLTVRQGQRVAINLHNKTAMAHPMHLHGHPFQVVEINGFEWSGPVRDTVLVPPLGDVTIAFDANNPGRWPFHCHNLYHQATGMMTEIVYA